MYVGEDKPKQKKEVNLMTVLACEATGDSKKLLRKHGKSDAKSHWDLEQKLTELYFASDDKPGLEKEMAEMHPHKNWIVRTLKLSPTPEQKQSEVIKSSVIEAQKSDQPSTRILSNADGYSNCEGGCMSCRFSKNSEFAGGSEKTSPAIPNYIGLVSIVAIVGLTFYFLNKK